MHIYVRGLFDNYLEFYQNLKTGSLIQETVFVHIFPHMSDFVIEQCKRIKI